MPCETESPTQDGTTQDGAALKMKPYSLGANSVPVSCGKDATLLSRANAMPCAAHVAPSVPNRCRAHANDGRTDAALVGARRTHHAPPRWACTRPEEGPSQESFPAPPCVSRASQIRARARRPLRQRQLQRISSVMPCPRMDRHHPSGGDPRCRHSICRLGILRKWSSHSTIDFSQSKYFPLELRSSRSRCFRRDGADHSGCVMFECKAR